MKWYGRPPGSFSASFLKKNDKYPGWQSNPFFPNDFDIIPIFVLSRDTRNR